MGTESVVKVGIAEMKLVRGTGSIRTTGLGSCVGLVLYDGRIHLAGMAHVMLPDSSFTKETTVNPGKYADLAIPGLVDLMNRHGADPSRLVCKMAGGAQMFQAASGSDIMRIGPRNVEAVKEQLDRLNIRIIAEDLGGNKGRTIEFFPETGMLQVRTVYEGTKEM
ncbi:chemotaxis protein CheD [Rossellomorea marisflavi]|uniref:chemotaxis protein CheD n=1 Tax=Rossellomorea marisflavi TaxID=189381 RepID=UPI003D2E3186